MSRRLIGAWLVAFLSLSSAARGFQAPTAATPRKRSGQGAIDHAARQSAGATIHVNPMVRDDEIGRRLAHLGTHEAV